MTLSGGAGGGWAPSLGSTWVSGPPSGHCAVHPRGGQAIRTLRGVNAGGGLPDPSCYAPRGWSRALRTLIRPHVAEGQGHFQVTLSEPGPTCPPQPPRPQFPPALWGLTCFCLICSFVLSPFFAAFPFPSHDGLHSRQEEAFAFSPPLM